MLFLLNLSICAQSQSRQIKYDTCTARSQYAGEWLYVNNSDTIKIFLKYQRIKSLQNYYLYDQLWGFLEFKHGNNIVYSDYYKRYDNIPFIIDTLMPFYNSVTLYSKKCYGNYLRQLNGNLTFNINGFQSYDVKAIVNSAGTEMTWHQDFHFTYHNSVTIPNNPPTGLNKMPDDFVLVKQP